MSSLLSDIFSGGTLGASAGVDIYQAAQIREVGQDANRAESAANRANDKAMETDRRVERLQLVMQAMWELLREREGITDAELEQRILEVDLRDGVRDGRMATQVMICEQCHRKTGVKAHSRCFYCGAALVGQHVVEG